MIYLSIISLVIERRWNYVYIDTLDRYLRAVRKSEHENTFEAAFVYSLPAKKCTGTRVHFHLSIYLSIHPSIRALAAERGGERERERKRAEEYRREYVLYVYTSVYIYIRTGIHRHRSVLSFVRGKK